MKKVLKVLGIMVGILVLGIAALLTYVKTALPNVGDAEDMKIEYTSGAHRTWQIPGALR